MPLESLIVRDIATGDGIYSTALVQSLGIKGLDTVLLEELP